MKHDVIGLSLHVKRNLVMKYNIFQNLTQLLLDDESENSSELVKEVVVILNALLVFFEIVFSSRN